MTGRHPLKILITGICAPPYGGVSVYVRRLCDSLNARGHYCRVYDQNYQVHIAVRQTPEGIVLLDGKWPLFWRILTGEAYDIIHINERSWKQRSVLVALARLKGMRTVITIHSLREDLRSMSLLERLLMRWTLRNADRMISSGENEVERLKVWYPSSSVTVITPFIPPISRELEAELPGEILDFCQRHAYSICGNGSNLDLYNGKNIYGLDMMVEACASLRKDWDVGFVFVLSGDENDPGLQPFREQIKRLSLEEHFLIYAGMLEFWKVIDYCDIFVRPTRTDSFGISVAESIYLRKPTVASDVCVRPEGTILFPAEDTGRMVEVLSELLTKMHNGAYQFEAAPPEDGSVLIETLYYELAGDYQ